MEKREEQVSPNQKPPRGGRAGFKVTHWLLEAGTLLSSSALSPHAPPPSGFLCSFCMRQQMFR